MPSRVAGILAVISTVLAVGAFVVLMVSGVAASLSGDVRLTSVSFLFLLPLMIFGIAAWAFWYHFVKERQRETKLTGQDRYVRMAEKVVWQRLVDAGQLDGMGLTEKASIGKILNIDPKTGSRPRPGGW
jgi:membrane protein implicated in regulation of membrane protease activity